MSYPEPRLAAQRGHPGLTSRFPRRILGRHIGDQAAESMTILFGPYPLRLANDDLFPASAMWHTLSLIFCHDRFK